MNYIMKVESAMHHVSDFAPFAINSSAVYLAETTGPPLCTEQVLIQKWS